MKKMKQILLAVFATLFTFSLAGCELGSGEGVNNILGGLFNSESKVEDDDEKDEEKEEEEDEKEEDDKKSDEEKEEEEEVEAGVPVLKGDEVFIYDEDGDRVDQDKTFLEIDGDTYYRDVYEHYYEDLLKILEEREDISDEMREIIEAYFNIIK